VAPGEKPLAQSPTYRANDQARSDGLLQGSVMRLAWSFFNPMNMMVVDTLETKQVQVMFSD